MDSRQPSSYPRAPKFQTLKFDHMESRLPVQRELLAEANDSLLLEEDKGQSQPQIITLRLFFFFFKYDVYYTVKDNRERRENMTENGPLKQIHGTSAEFNYQRQTNINHVYYAYGAETQS